MLCDFIEFNVSFNFPSTDRSMLFSFQVFGDLPVFIQLLTSSLIPVWLANTLCMIQFLLNLLLVCFVAHDMVYVGI